MDERIEEQERLLASANKSDIISFSPLFSFLSKGKIKKISPLLKKRKVSLDEIIFKEGDPSEEFYIVKSGKVLIYRYIDPGKTRFEALASLCKGDIFGEMGIIDEESRSAYARAVLEPCELYYMGKEDFLCILKKYPEISLNLNRIYSHRLRVTNQKLIDYLISSSLRSHFKSPEGIEKKSYSTIDLGEDIKISSEKILVGNEVMIEVKKYMPPEKTTVDSETRTLSSEEVIQKRRQMLIARSKSEDLSKGILFRKRKSN